MRNLTKASRDNSRAAQFNHLLSKGYIQETYKALDFFTKEEGKYFTLKVFRGTAANHEEYCNYHSEQSRANKIDNYKINYERRLQWKAEQKEKNKGKSSSHAGAAAAIKAELQNKFKGVKFSCTSDSFSMGDSVHIGWEDGPTINEVEAITQKYQYGSFNGMEDLYEYTNSRDDIPQVKYVQERRNQSEELKVLLPAFSAQFPPEMLKDYHNEPTQIFYRIFARTSFPANYINPRIEKTSETCGLYEDFYNIVFDTPEAAQKPEQPNFKPVEVATGEINIIDYSEKAIAVIGDTKPIKDKLKALGGSFNPRLSCGAGWIFSKNKLAEVIAALSSEEAEPTQEILALPTPAETRKHPEFEHAHPLNICDPESSQYKQAVKEYLTHEQPETSGVLSTNAKGQKTYTFAAEGGSYKGKPVTITNLGAYSSSPNSDRVNIIYGKKVNQSPIFWSGGSNHVTVQQLNGGRCGDLEIGYNEFADILEKIGALNELRSYKRALAAWMGTEEETEPTTLKDEIKKTIEFFAETDIKICGEVTESTKECARAQNIPLEENAQIYYDNLKDITAAAYGGKIISLCNLSQLVNAR